MSDVSMTDSAALPNTTTTTLFEVTDIVRIVGMVGRITVQPDDPYNVTIRIGSETVATAGIGDAPAGRVISNVTPTTTDAGLEFGSGYIAYDGTTITVQGSHDPGSGEASWLVVYEPLEPNASVTAA